MQQVADWLEKLGLGQYAQRFAENDISFVILPDLTDQDLEKTGVASLGHRRLLLRAIAELKTPTSDTAALAPSASAKIDAAERRHVTVMCPKWELEMLSESYEEQQKRLSLSCPNFSKPPGRPLRGLPIA